MKAKHYLCIILFDTLSQQIQCCSCRSMKTITEKCPFSETFSTVCQTCAAALFINLRPYS